MKHKFLKILGILFVVIFAVALMQTTAFALTDGDYEYTYYHSGVETAQYTGPGGDVVIPSTIGGEPVLSIGGCTFGNNNITSITIPSTVTNISSNAFIYCTSLSNIYFMGTSAQWDAITKGANWSYGCPCGDTVHIVYTYTVEDNKATITGYDGPGGEVVIPSTLDGYTVTAIDDEAFKDKTNITAVTIPEGVKTIGENAFHGCSNLETVTLPSTLEVVGGGAFIYCSKINRVDVADIAKWCAVKFYDNTSNPFTLGNNFNKLYVDGQKISDLVIPEGVTSIGSMAFFGCMGLKSVTLPSTLNSIENFAFSYCTGIKSITIPDGVTTIGVNAFSNCTGLQSITIPEGVTSIRQGAFMGCTSLSNIYFMGTSAQWAAVSKGKDWNEDCPCGDNAHIVYTYTVEDGKATITEYDGFGGNAVIPSTLDGYPVTAIGNQAFKNKGSITAVTIPEGVTSIEEYAFIGCSKLETVTLPSTLEAVGGGAFIDCDKINRVDVADIAAWCAVEFAGVSSNPLARGETFDKLYVGGELIHELVIPEGVTDIRQYAFYRCEGLTSVTFPSTLVTIGDYAFCKCTSLEIAIMPTSLKSIGENAFYQIGESKLVMQYLGTINEWHEVTKGDDWSDYGQPNRMKYAYQYILSDGKATLTKYDGLGGNVVIPSTLDGYPVTAIGNNAFKDKTNITAVTVPEGVTSIAQNAFKNCSNLETVTLPSTIETVGENAFYGCDKISAVNVADIAKWCAVSFYDYSSNPLALGDNFDKLYVGGELVHELVIPEGVTSIGNSAFELCQGLTSVSLPSTLTSIGDGAFEYCSSLQSITIPEGVTTIEGGAFFKCSNLETVTLPSTLTSIGNSAFQLCNKINHVDVADIEKWCAVSFNNDSSNPLARGETYDKLYFGGELVHELVIPDGVKSIGKYAFYSCQGLTSVTFPSTLESIGKFAFYYCTGLESITVPSTLTSIGSGVFQRCTGFENITIPEGVTTIGDSMFSGCTGIQSITIPSTVTSIDDYAFYECSSLADIYFAGTSAQWEAISKESHWNLFSPCGDNVHIIYTYTVSNGKATLTVYDGPGGDVDIPSTFGGCPLTAIGDHVFKEKDNITSVTIPEGVTTIGDNAFDGCSDLETLTLPSTLESVGNMAFYACGLLSRVNVADIAKWCAVEFVNSASNPFSEGCDFDKFYVGGELVHELVIPEGVTSIGQFAFEYCQGFTSVTLPSTLVTIGDGAFMECTGLESITIPEGVTTVKAYTFYGCTSLESVTIPSTVTSIGEYAFRDCYSLESVTIPKVVTSIEKFAFNSCASLNDVYYYGTAAEWSALPKGGGCFENNPATQKIHYMCTVTVSSASNTTGTAAGGGVCEIGIPVTVTATPAEHYAFVNWTVGGNVVSTDPAYEFTPTGDTQLVANFALEKFTITFKNEDDSVLWSGDFEYGTKPVYGGETPTKANDGDIVFTFCGWFPKIDTVTEEATYYVLFGIETDQVCDECGKTLYGYPSVSDKDYHYAFCFNDECVNFAGLPMKYQSHYGAEPTCTHLSVCEFCGVAFGEINPDNHLWDDGVVTVEPTCTEDGVLTFTCKHDNSHTRTEVIPAKGHVSGEPVRENVAEPTCTTEGSYDSVIYCTVCGAELSRFEVRSAALGHDYGEWAVTTPATCTKDGVETRVCKNNEKHTETRAIAAKGHDFGEWVVITAPTEFEEGVEVRVCSICGEEETRSIEKLDHTHKMIHYEYVAPTETEEGNKEYYVCSVCGKWYEDAEGKTEIKDHGSVVISPLGKSDPIVYGFKVEPETVWTKGSGKDFVLTSVADFSKFIGAKVDGQFLDKSYFTAEEGSTKVSFKSEYLDTLPAGEHTLSVVSEDGEASATVNIVADPVTPDGPDEPTKTNSPVILIIIALVVAAVAAAAVVVVIVVKKKK